MSEVPTEPIVTFTLRELLQEIKKDQTRGFAELATKLDMKADKADLERLYGKFEALEDRTEKLEHWRSERDSAAKAHWDAKNWRLAVVGGLATVVIAAASIVPTVLR